jgi:vacuolar-type H+-ATPase subunit H
MALRKKKSLLDQAQDYVDQVRPHVESAVATTREAVEDFVENTALPAIADAKDKAGPAVQDARAKAGPKLKEARAKAAPVVADARAKAAPVVADVAARAGEAAAQAKEAADARVATLRGEEPEKKGGKLKKIALFAAIAGAVGFVAKKLQGGGQQADTWQSSYVPKPAPAPAPVKDTGGSAPDEAISDAADEPHPVTTPDEPAEVIDLEETVEKPAPKKATKK